jgi:hypothetical protein
MTLCGVGGRSFHHRAAHRLVRTGTYVTYCEAPSHRAYLDYPQRELVNDPAGSIYRMRAPQRRPILSTRARYRMRRSPEIAW